ncbi:lipopolysaccharide assembly protein LapB [Pseudomaricurvus sp. HS19]|uniref:lipopolysaccharide assembly protein LapB n=1 Tax=Pseudomaricurvus sp. HS19 TaxID=2692626 RepID=UPI0013703551|nr:lipopolysaccharide assembly protein LapB [Pseudomaricurvus sp. HS19]MYM62880.1 lipopolysaccharide assembly protein LapB [Pseudomaricurvus sp. HS19]
MTDVALFALLLVAVAIGFFFGRLRRKDEEGDEDTEVQAQYIRGLNYLLNEQPDAAIDTFIDSLDVTPSTLETHLALGNLLRKRGEVGRAIKIHQNLLARPRLDPERSQQVQLELARDYMKSGLLDRAELLLRELADSASYPLRTECQEYLIEIYRDEKEWAKAIEVISRLPGRRFTRIPERWRLVQAHFYCELAAESLARSDYLAARRHLRAAMAADRQSARASLLLAELEINLGHHREAVKALKQVFYQDPAMLPEALPMLETCYRHGGLLPQLREYLQELLNQGASLSVAIRLAELMVATEGPEAAAQFLRGYILQNPTIAGVRQLLHLQCTAQREPGQQWLQLEQMLDELNRQHPRYRCLSCGFAGHRLHWLCPSCKTWGSVKPVD